jgi:hypothetical protein
MPSYERCDFVWDDKGILMCDGLHDKAQMCVYTRINFAAVLSIIQNLRAEVLELRAQLKTASGGP